MMVRVSPVIHAKLGQRDLRLRFGSFSADDQWQPESIQDVDAMDHQRYFAWHMQGLTNWVANRITLPEGFKVIAGNARELDAGREIRVAISELGQFTLQMERKKDNNDRIVTESYRLTREGLPGRLNYLPDFAKRLLAPFFAFEIKLAEVVNESAVSPHRVLPTVMTISGKRGQHHPQLSSPSSRGDQFPFPDVVDGVREVFMTLETLVNKASKSK